MQAPRKPETNPSQDTDAVTVAPEDAEAAERARELRELFGAPEVTDEQTDAEAIASRERLAELFGRKPQTHSSPRIFRTHGTTSPTMRSSRTMTALRAT